MIMGIYAHEYLWSHHRAVLEELRRRGESHFKNRDERVKKKKEKLSIFHLSLNLSTHTHTVPQQIVLFAHECSNLIFSSQPWHYSRAVALEPVGKQGLTLGRTEGLWVGSEQPALPCWLPLLWVQLQRLFSATSKSVPSSDSLLPGIRLQLFLLSGWVAWGKWHW